MSLKTQTQLVITVEQLKQFRRNQSYIYQGADLSQQILSTYPMQLIKTSWINLKRRWTHKAFAPATAWLKKAYGLVGPPELME